MKFDSITEAYRNGGSLRYGGDGLTFLHAPYERTHPDTLYMGAELEFEFPGSDEALAVANAVADSPLWGFSSDGSLVYQSSLELRTQPMTWRYFTERFDWSVFDALAAARASSYPRAQRSGSPSAGIHIHVPQAAFTPDEMYRFLQFVYGNAELCQKVGGRLSNSYGAFAHKMRDPQTPRRLREMADAVTSESGASDRQFGRYVAVNLNHKYRTAELRYFRSTPRRERFQGLMEWVHGTVMLAKTPTLPLTEEGILTILDDGAHTEALKIATAKEPAEAE